MGICQWVETNGAKAWLRFMHTLFMKKSALYNAPDDHRTLYFQSV
jgi:hypothetical protein